MDLADNDVAMVFIALGHFERKGLPLVIAAMQDLKNPALKLLIVGGEADLMRTYQNRVNAVGLDSQVRFFGMQTDIRSYLWVSDVFIFPSAYETFSLVSFQAAAAGLPIIVPRIYGLEEFAKDGINSIIIQADHQAVREGIARFMALSVVDRQEMGRRAQEDVRRFSADNFDAAWRDVYARCANAPAMEASR